MGVAARLAVPLSRSFTACLENHEQAEAFLKAANDQGDDDGDAAAATNAQATNQISGSQSDGEEMQRRPGRSRQELLRWAGRRPIR